MAIWADFLYFSDGAHTAFAIATGEPWSLLWHDFPTRVGTFLLSGGPALLGQVVGASPRVVGKVYQATFFAVPLISLGFLLYFSPREERPHWLSWFSIAFFLLAMNTFGFPTETWVIVCLAFPMLASIVHPPKRKFAIVLAFLLPPVFCFSHETAALCSPAILAAFYVSFRARGRRCESGTYLHMLLGCFVACGIVWLALFIGFQPENPHVEKGFSENQAHLWSFAFLRIRVIQWSVLMLTALTLLALLWDRVQKYRRLLDVAFLSSALLVCRYFLGAHDRYMGGRTAIVWLFPAFLLFCVVLLRRIEPAAVNRLILPVMAAQMVINANAIAGWTTYTDALDRYVRDSGPMPVPGAAWREYVRASLPRNAQYYWGWSAPYTSLMLRPERSGGLIIDDRDWYAPMTCAQARARLPQLAWPAAVDRNIIVQDICTKNPA